MLLTALGVKYDVIYFCSVDELPLENNVSVSDDYCGVFMAGHQKKRTNSIIEQENELRRFSLA